MDYTKGEWKVGKIPPLSNWVVGVSLGDPMNQDVVASLYNNETDARLISAAPDLYEACKLALNFIGRDKQTRIILEKAITKAETNL